MYLPRVPDEKPPGRQRDLPPLDPGERVGVPARLSYFEDARTPLTMLVFLLPLVILYEIGAWRFLMGSDDAATWEVSAQRLLSSVFEVFGVAGLHLPALLIVVVLLTAHVLSRQPWSVKPSVLAGMAIESCALAIPLVLMAALLAPGFAAAALPAQSDITSLGFGARTTISLGAGLYEEMLFRLIGITAAHFVLADLLRLGDRLATWIAILLCAFAFAAYHEIPSLQVGAFYVLAGVYFGAVYVFRGFGIVVACHAAYDLVALVIAPAAVAAGHASG